MLEAVAVNESTLLGALIALLVFGVLRYVDEIVEVLASLDESGLTDRPD